MPQLCQNPCQAQGCRGRPLLSSRAQWRQANNQTVSSSSTGPQEVRARLLERKTLRTEGCGQGQRGLGQGELSGLGGARRRFAGGGEVRTGRGQRGLWGGAGVGGAVRTGRGQRELGWGGDARAGQGQSGRSCQGRVGPESEGLSGLAGARESWGGKVMSGLGGGQRELPCGGDVRAGP